MATVRAVLVVVVAVLAEAVAAWWTVRRLDGIGSLATMAGVGLIPFVPWLAARAAHNALVDRACIVYLTVVAAAALVVAAACTAGLFAPETIGAIMVAALHGLEPREALRVLPRTTLVLAVLAGGAVFMSGEIERIAAARPRAPAGMTAS